MAVSQYDKALARRRIRRLKRALRGHQTKPTLLPILYEDTLESAAIRAEPFRIDHQPTATELTEASWAHP